MRKLTAGNKPKFTIFALIILSVMAVLIVFLYRSLKFENEKYEINKNMFIYDKNYENIELTSDAEIQRKWTGDYYLNEIENNLSYNLGSSVIAYDTIRNNLSLIGTFYEIATNGQVTKYVKNTEVKDIMNSKIYKIEDRKYLLVSNEIKTENNSLTAENYLIVVIDKSGNTLLLNNNMDIKTINQIILETDAYKFDIANEKLICNDEIIDLKKVIGSTNEFIAKVEEKEENKQNGGTTITAGGGTASAYNGQTINIGGTTAVMSPSTGTVGTTDETSSNNKPNKDDYTAYKSASIKKVTTGSTYLDVNYDITDPKNKYQVVYILINGGKKNEVISLDKSAGFYKITNLQPNTDYTLTLGYKEIKNDNTVEEVTEDVLNVRTEKLTGMLNITKVTPEKIYYNLKIDSSADLSTAVIKIYVNGTEKNKITKINKEEAISANGWTSSITNADNIKGRLTIKLENVKNVDLTASTEIY